MKRLKELFLQLIDLVLRSVSIFTDNKMEVYSGNATLFIMISFVPFFMLVVAIVNLLPGYSLKDLLEIILQILPDLEPIKKLIEYLLESIKNQTSGLLISVTAITTLYSASKGVSAIKKGLDQLDGQEEEIETEDEENIEIKKTGKKLFWGLFKRIIFTLLMVILLPVLLVIEMFGDTTVTSIVSSLVIMVLVLFVIIQIYAFLPAIHKKLKSQVPGALLSGICWTVFTKLFSIFVPLIYSSSHFLWSYGSNFTLGFVDLLHAHDTFCGCCFEPCFRQAVGGRGRLFGDSIKKGGLQ